MKKIFSYSLLFCFCILFFTTCKKYKEDERRYLFCSPECRLVGRFNTDSKWWQLESFLVDGVDSSIVYCKQPPPWDTCPGWAFGYKYYKDPHVIDQNYGSWNFLYKKNVIIINNSGGGQPPLFISPQGTSKEWQIEKLTKKEFWIKTEYNGKKYYLKMSSHK